MCAHSRNFSHFHKPKAFKLNIIVTSLEICCLLFALQVNWIEVRMEFWQTLLFMISAISSGLLWALCAHLMRIYNFYEIILFVHKNFRMLFNQLIRSDRKRKMNTLKRNVLVLHSQPQRIIFEYLIWALKLFQRRENIGVTLRRTFR